MTSVPESNQSEQADTRLAVIDLSSLAIAINEEHALAEQYASMAVHRAKRAGGLLNQAKTQVTHGQWLPWLAENCPAIAARTAQAYMRLDREWQTLESKCATVAHLTINEALKLITEPDSNKLSPDEQRELEYHERRIFESLTKLEASMTALAEGVRKMKAGIGPHFGGFEQWCSQEIGLDAALRDMLLDPSCSWNYRDMSDKQHELMLCWMLRMQGLSDEEARTTLEGTTP